MCCTVIYRCTLNVNTKSVLLVFKYSLIGILNLDNRNLEDYNDV